MTDPNVTICGMTIRRTYVVWLFCAFISVVAGIIASPDSPFAHSLLGHIDSAWFLDAGRWLMQGYTPYIDFADSKGPLLWLFYGIGYLLDNDGWTGIFCLYVLYFIPVYRYVWLLAKEVSGNDRVAAATVIFMTYAYMCPLHQENRAEDLLQLPLIYMLYLIARVFNHRRITRKEYFIAGVAMGCMLFVKWNFPAMLLPLPFIALAYDSHSQSKCEPAACSRQKYFSQNLCTGLAGAGVVILIVSIWMACVGSFTAMIQEYFVNTVLTAQEGDGSALYRIIGGLKYMLAGKFVLLVIISVPIYAYLRFGVKGLWLAFSAYWILALASIHFFPYYTTAVISYGVFIPLLAMLLLGRRLKIKIWMLASELLLLVLMLGYYAKHHVNYGKTAALEKFENLISRIDRIENPRILYFNNSNFSLGIQVNAQPPCRYWASQYGATRPMNEDQLKAMATLSVDVVVTEVDDYTPEKYGYITAPVDTFPGPYPQEIKMRIHWSPILKSIPK